jgi:hypothetical protein
VRAVALESTLESVVGLGLLVLIRIFLSWFLVVEIEGRWPWQAERQEGWSSSISTGRSRASSPSASQRYRTC